MKNGYQAVSRTTFRKIAKLQAENKQFKKQNKNSKKYQQQDEQQNDKTLEAQVLTLQIKPYLKFQILFKKYYAEQIDFLLALTS